MSTKKKILYIAVTALYLAGLVCMVIDFPVGLTVWGFAFIVSFVVFLFGRNKETLDEVREAEMKSEEEDSEKEEAEKKDAAE